MQEIPQQLFIQRSSMLNGINRMGRFLRFAGLNPFRLDADRLMANARKQAGFEGEIPETVQEGVRVLVHAINTEARPNPFGELAVKGLLERTMYGRMKVEQYFQEHPETAEEEIREPVFIIGMPRTGTTILHALLHQDPGHRSPLAWECLLPHPVPRPENYRDNAQVATIRKEFGQLFKLVPDFLQKHYMAADSPQECIGINALDFNTFQVSAQLYVPSYMHWFANEANRLETMRWHKRFLQYLQSGGVRGTRWLLKSPVHLMRLPELFSVYPDARVIMTHREPSKIVPSAASLISSVRSLYSDHEDPFRTGAEQAATWSDYFNRFLESRRTLDKESRIMDIRFEEFVSDQTAVAKTIYERFDWQLSAETEGRFRKFLEENPKDKNGAHNYTLEDFGLTESGISEQYRGYSDFLKTLHS